jgi:hypothetical protein
MERDMNEPKKTPMSNGPRQKEVKKIKLPQRYADSMTTMPTDEETLAWIKAKAYPEAMKDDLYRHEDTEESNKT